MVHRIEEAPRAGGERMRQPGPLTAAAVARATPPPVDPPTPDEIRGIVEAHSPFVWRTLRFLGVRDADLEDACQEVFIVVCRKLGDFEARSTLKSWLRGICIKKAAAHRRRAHVRNEIPVDGPASEVPASDNPEAAIKSQEQLAILDRALDTLDQDKRAVFVLYEIEELAMKEVAEALGCPLQTAYSRYHAARDRVTTFVRREGGV